MSLRRIIISNVVTAVVSFEILSLVEELGAPSTRGRSHAFQKTPHARRGAYFQASRKCRKVLVCMSTVSL